MRQGYYAVREDEDVAQQDADKYLVTRQPTYHPLHTVCVLSTCCVRRAHKKKACVSIN